MSDASPLLYIGRFAPSPTGLLHFGSLIAAVGSYLQARAVGGRWLLRIEDLDPPRVMPGATDAILSTLEAFGFEWDGEVVYQSERDDAYAQALQALATRGVLYRCNCSRKDIAAQSVVGKAGLIYPGSCRQGPRGSKDEMSWRVRTDGAFIRFEDALQGAVDVDLEREIGDFTVQRADGIFAYHLALVVDDAAAGVTEIVRGYDLLASTAPQIHLQHLLGLPTPRYLHLPIAVNADGDKLSKQTHAPPLDAATRHESLAAALTFLGHPPPAEARG